MVIVTKEALLRTGDTERENTLGRTETNSGKFCCEQKGRARKDDKVFSDGSYEKREYSNREINLGMTRWL